MAREVSLVIVGTVAIRIKSEEIGGTSGACHLLVFRYGAKSADRAKTIRRRDGCGRNFKRRAKPPVASPRQSPCVRECAAMAPQDTIRPVLHSLDTPSASVGSGENARDYLAMHVSQAEIAARIAVGQALVVETEEMQDRGM